MEILFFEKYRPYKSSIIFILPTDRPTDTISFAVFPVDQKINLVSSCHEFLLQKYLFYTTKYGDRGSRAPGTEGREFSYTLNGGSGTGNFANFLEHFFCRTPVSCEQLFMGWNIWFAGWFY